MSDTVFLNGELVAREDAKISVMDRGFLFGDGVYEVIPVYNGKLFRLAEHLQRLQNSLDGIQLANPYSDDQWQRYLQDLVNNAGGGDLSLYLQVTRGAAEKRDHAFPTDVEPTIFAMTSAFAPPAGEILAQGLRAVTVEDIRWKWCHIKSIALLGNVLLKQQALDTGADEAILIRDGLATEGSASNLFAVIDGTLVTPPKGPKLLPGITRDLVVELSAQHQLPCVEREISQTELGNADEIWVTSSTREIVAVTELDDTPVGDGKPGPIWRQMFDWYQAYKEALRRGEAE